MQKINYLIITNKDEKGRLIFLSAEQKRGDTGILRTKSEMKWIKKLKKKEVNEVDINYLKHQLKDFNILKLKNDEGFNKLEEL